MRDLDIHFLKAQDLLGLIDSKDIVKAATEALSDCEDDCILDLALCNPSDYECVARAKRALYESHNLDKMDKGSAIVFYALNICKKILERAIDPIAGSKMIASAIIYNNIEGLPDLDPFIYILSEADSRTFDREFFTSAAIREAEEFYKRHSR